MKQEFDDSFFTQNSYLNEMAFELRCHEINSFLDELLVHLKLRNPTTVENIQLTVFFLFA